MMDIVKKQSGWMVFAPVFALSLLLLSTHAVSGGGQKEIFISSVCGDANFLSVLEIESSKCEAIAIKFSERCGKYTGSDWDAVLMSIDLKEANKLLLNLGYLKFECMKSGIYGEVLGIETQ